MTAKTVATRISVAPAQLLDSQVGWVVSLPSIHYVHFRSLDSHVGWVVSLPSIHYVHFRSLDSQVGWVVSLPSIHYVHFRSLDSHVQPAICGSSSPCSRVYMTRGEAGIGHPLAQHSGAVAQPVHPVDDVHDQMKAVEVIEHHHVERRRRGARAP